MKQSWKRVSTKKLFEHPRLTVFEDEVVLPDGYKTEYLRYQDHGDYVTVIALRNDEVALINEYAYPADKWLWQFPDGDIKEEESVQQAAARELLEEAGLKAEEFFEIGSWLQNHRRWTKRGHAVVATGILEGSKAQGDREEQGTTLHWVSVTQLERMVANGEIIQQNALAALGLYFVHSATKAQA